MKASIVDLRYQMKKVLAALRRRETVEVHYHGKPAGLLVPIPPKGKARDLSGHPFFGMHRGMPADRKSVKKVMDELRGGRYRAL